MQLRNPLKDIHAALIQQTKIVQRLQVQQLQNQKKLYSLLEVTVIIMEDLSLIIQALVDNGLLLQLKNQRKL
jgi:hypothetical protein